MNQLVKNLPDFSFEKYFWDRGYKYVAGLDEVGRGSFAGPAAVGLVIFEKELAPRKIKIDDSKRLTIKQREEASDWIRKKALYWSIEEIPVSQINRNGVHRSIHSGFRRVVTQSVKRNSVRVDYLLVDGYKVPYFRDFRTYNKTIKDINEYVPGGEKQLAITSGDRKSFSIAAASIVAKVYRDNLMKDLSKYPEHRCYHWHKNKGYGTEAHRKAILKHGVCDLHRKDFVNTFLAKVNQ